MHSGSVSHDVTEGADAGVVVPVRSFTGAKARLSSRLDPLGRAALAQRLADTVVRAAGPLPVVIVSSAPEVRDWATARSLPCIDDPGSLDGASAAGRAWFDDRGLARIVIAHADLPFARTFAAVATGGGVPTAVIVPCHRNDGTPVLAVPVGTPFEFRYGPGSFARHVAEARRCHLQVRVHRDVDLRFDVDVPEDLDEMASRA
jgi:2-phospho-L-lactate guanylyltransferase